MAQNSNQPIFKHYSVNIVKKNMTSAPYSLHENGKAERNGRLLLEMAEWMIIENGQLKTF